MPLDTIVKNRSSQNDSDSRPCLAMAPPICTIRRAAITAKPTPAAKVPGVPCSLPIQITAAEYQHRQNKGTTTRLKTPYCVMVLSVPKRLRPKEEAMTTTANSARAGILTHTVGKFPMIEEAHLGINKSEPIARMSTD